MTETETETGILRDWGWDNTRGKGKGLGTRGTALAVCEHFLCLGTHNGHLLWYDRRTAKTETLHTQQYSAITFVKIVSTVDFMVAAGNKNGTVTIFQIPKAHPESLPKTLKLKEVRPIERFTVGSLHKSEVTYIEWSKNGMRLFSGDKNGLVVMTEIDFYMHICKSSEIINESYEIVQISYFQDYLLVSSVFRSIICHKKNNKWDITQVGKKERKNLVKLGGVFHFSYERPNNVNIYCGRPGFRLWTSDKEGNVLQTLLFKDAIACPTSQVELIKPHKKPVKSAKELNFGHIHIFNEKYLLTYNEDQLYILNPETLVAIAVIDNLKRISAVSVNKDEIFILDDEIDIVRIAYHPDFQEEKSDQNLMTKSLTNPIQLAVNTIKDIAESESQVTFSDMADSCDNFLASIISHDKPRYTKEPIVDAEECFEDSFELPPIKELPLEIDTNILDKIMHKFISDEEGLIDAYPATYTQNKNEKISEENSEEILYSDAPQSIKKTKNTKIINFDDSQLRKYDNGKEEKSTNIKKENTSKSTVLSNKILPIQKSEIKSKTNDTSPDTLEKEIQHKEEMLAKILNLEPITISPMKVNYEPIINNIQIENITPFVKNIPVKNDISPKSITHKKQYISSTITMSPPECVSIPDQWNIQKVEIVGGIESLRKPIQKLPSLEENDDWVLL